MPRLIVLDPSQAVAVIVEELAERYRYALHYNVEIAHAEPGDVVLVTSTAVAGQSTVGASLAVLAGARKVVLGDADQASKVASASSLLGADTVVLSPFLPVAFGEILAPSPANSDTDLARARALMSASVMDVADDATFEGLAKVAHAFMGDDCIVWWREGETMRPRTARVPPESGYRTSVATAARIAAAADATVVLVVGGEVRSVSAIALSVGNNEVTGLMAVVADRPRQFSLQERDDLRTFAPRVAREFSWRTGYLRLIAEGDGLRSSILHDPLTGTLTRVALEQASTQEVAAAQRRGEALSLVVFDIIGMRRMNLRLGHRIGDELLARLASRLRSNVRSNDPVGRYGGDELAVILTGADVHQARVVTEKLLAKLVDPPFEIEGVVIDLQLRAVIAPISAGERSGEAAFARVAAHLRHAAPGVIIAEDGDERQSGDVGQASLSIGATLGGTYRVRHELSRGAMGVVYRGEDIGLGRPVAIKVLRSDLASDHELVERFRAEAAMLASLRHDNLVQVYALGEHAGEVYFVMELVEGQPLSDVLRSLVERAEWFPPAAIAQIALEIGDALDAMHAVGLIHRDVKPANILLDRDSDRAVLVDVGVAARAGDQSEAAGTPGFSAPESFLDGAESPATDVYGLGATVYCMLTCQPPFGVGNLAQIITRQLHEELPQPSSIRPQLSPAVDKVIAKALDPEPSRRWASASAFAVALSTALERLISDEHRAQSPSKPPIVALQRELGTHGSHGSARVAAALKMPTIQSSPPAAPADDLAPISEGFREPSQARREGHITKAANTLSPPFDHAARVAGRARFTAPGTLSTDPPSMIQAQGFEETGAFQSARLRNIHFRVAARVISHRYGSGVLRRVSDLDAGIAAALMPNASPLGWDEVVLFVALLHEAVPEAERDEVCELIGRASVSATFAQFLGAEPTSVAPEKAMRALPTFWNRYHDWSHPTVVVANSHVQIVVVAQAMDPVIATMVRGQVQRMLELCGGRQVDISQHFDATHAVYNATWVGGGDTMPASDI